ncbi:hypothetical protein [uncultured Sulfitobacter sp.]|uniref:hypothetical protein n=1 Tax=uncultured Sulfitobacter sp. TaxID=191468 RepID=UPI0025D4A105|nr:hypothetical protein [uncultured Sulfitobacter sp.]
MDKTIAEVQQGMCMAADFGIYAFTKEGGTVLAPLGTFEGKAPEAALELVKKREAEIMSGDFTVEIDDCEPTSP